MCTATGTVRVADSLIVTLGVLTSAVGAVSPSVELVSIHTTSVDVQGRRA